MKHFPLILLTAGVLAAGASADRVGLVGENVVTGAVSGIDGQGQLVIDSPNAAAPLLLRSAALRSIEFDGTAPEHPDLQERLHLTNGDVLPGLLKGMDANHIDFQTWFAEDLRVPRTAVRSIDFGIAPQKLVFKGPGGPEGWLDNEGWKFRGTTLRSTERGTISRRKVLPEQFILRFQLAWESNPNFRFYFCDDLLEEKGDADRYYFDINTSGMQLRRQSTSDEDKWKTLYLSQRRPAEFRDKNVDIELRVDRVRHLIYIYVDGELEGRFQDQIPPAPTGSGIMLMSNAGGEIKNTISSIEIYQWDATSQLHRSEGHEDPTHDAIITTDSERHGGTVQGMAEEEGERVLLLKNPHADDLFHIPLRRTSVLYFRQAEALSPQSGSFRIELADQGRIQLAALRLDVDTLSGRHPLLEALTIKREAVVSIKSTAPADDANAE
jgi:hypothetical protein